MTPVYVVQQCNILKYAEQHDSLDQRWIDYLQACQLLPILLPNKPDCARELLSAGLAKCAVLTGGDLYSSDTSDKRSEVERLVFEWSKTNGYPLVGTCRGMQAMMQFYGAELQPCDNQVLSKQTIQFLKQERDVNSYHRYTSDVPSPLFELIGECDQGVPKAVISADLKWLGIMWHPERLEPFRNNDIFLFKQFLNEGSLCRL